MERNYFLYISVFLTIAILIGSLISVENVAAPKIHSFDKIVHFGAYCALTISWLIALSEKLSSFKKILYVGLLLLIYGIVIEVLQITLTAHRQADFLDILANFAGVLIAVSVFSIFLRKKQQN